MRNPKTALSGLIVCLTLSGLMLASTGCAGTRHKRSTGAYVDDKAVSTRVKTALFRDPLVSGFDVKVNTYRGEVQLNGFVDNNEQKERAASIAREVPGVELVTNNLEVKPADPAVGTSGAAVERSTRSMSEPMLDRSATDPNRDALSNEVAPLPPVRHPGQIADPAPLRTVPDRSAADRINGSTTAQNPDLAPLDLRTPRNLKIDASNGRATLHGTVHTEFEKRDIERRVRDIPGVQSVDNQIEVQPPAPVRQ